MAKSPDPRHPMLKTMFLAFFLLISCLSLEAQNDPEPIITTGHKSQITSLDFSPDGKFLVSGGLDNFVKVWDLNLRQEYRTLFGHKNGLKKVQFSPDGSLIASQSLGGDLLIFSHPEGKQLPLRQENMSVFAFFPDSKSILISKIMNTLTRKNAVSGEIEQEYDGIPTNRFVLHPNGNQVLGNGPGKQDTLRWFDLNSNRETRNIATIANWLQITISFDGKWVALANTTGDLEVIDVESGKSQFRTKAQTLYFSAIKFSPDGKSLFALDLSKKIIQFNSVTGKGKEFLNFSWKPEDVMKMVENGEPITSLMPQFAMSRDGKLMGLCLQQSVASLKEKKAPQTLNKIKLLALDNAREVGEFVSPFKIPFWMDIAPGGDEMLISDLGSPLGIRHWNLKEGQIDRYQQTSPYAALSPDGKTLAYYKINLSTLKMNLFVEDRISQEILHAFEVETAGYSVAFSPDGKKISACYYSFDKSDYSMVNYLREWEIESEKVLWTRTLEKLESGFLMEYSPDGKHLFLKGLSQLTIWQTENGEKIPEIEKRGWQQWIGFSPDGKYAMVAGLAENNESQGSRIHLIDLKTGKIADHYYPEVTGLIYSGEFSPDGKYLALGTGGVFGDFEFNVELFEWPSRKKVCSFTGHHASVTLIKWSREGDKLLSAANDGMIKMWDWKNCSEKATLIAMEERDFIILEPGGKYKASKGNLQGVGFRYQQKLFSYEQLDLRFNRPDLVMKSLGAPEMKVKMLKMAWKKRLRKLGFTEAQMTGELTLPEIEIQQKSHLPLSSQEKFLTFRVQAQDKSNKLDRLNLYVNNVPVYGMKGKSLKAASSGKYSGEIEVELSAGINRIQVSVMNERGLESFRESFEVKSEREAQKPDLYLLTLGVSEYQDAERNLRFASKDAKDLATALSNSPRFGQVHVKTLTNDEVSKETVSDAASFFDNSKVNDVVAVFYSGHGLISESLDYYLATPQVDFLKPELNGLPYETLESLVDKVPARSRLVIIDACHSGEIDKEETGLEPVQTEHGQVAMVFKGGVNAPKPKAGLNNSFAYMQALFADLTKGTGATVISAAGGYEFALESEDWNNGVFTYSILQGLKSKDADLNQDQKVHLSELKNYVTDKVSTLTNGMQVPTSRKENLGVDFVIF